MPSRYTMGTDFRQLGAAVNWRVILGFHPICQNVTEVNRFHVAYILRLTNTSWHGSRCALI